MSNYPKPVIVSFACCATVDFSRMPQQPLIVQHESVNFEDVETLAAALALK